MKKAELTRLNILQKAYELIYTKGYQATSIDEIIATTKVTKGAFYYHFKNKDEMGIAVVNEVLSATTGYHFQLSAIIDRDPVETIYQMMHELLIENKFMKVEYGCPVSNLVQEMTLGMITSGSLKKEAAEWEKRLVTILENGKKMLLYGRMSILFRLHFSSFQVTGESGILASSKTINLSICTT